MTAAQRLSGNKRERRFKPYPAYKDSGVEWLGGIPADWELKAVKRVAKLRAGTAITAESIQEVGEFPVFGGNGIRGFNSSYTHDGRFPLIGRQGALCGCVSFASGKFWASEHAVVAASQTGIDPAWLAFLLCAMTLNDFSQSAAQPGLAVETISALRVPVPRISEQRAIAAFLDRETARIDALVAKKERLIELLQEKRRALITRAVTKGLDPNAPKKDSGVNWLGQIPAHWEVKRLWHLTPSARRIMYGIVLPGPNVDDGVPIIKGGDVSPERLRLDRLSRTTFEIESGYVRSRVRGGDLVYAIRGSIGEAAMIPLELEGANLTQDAARVAYTPATHGPWLLQALRSVAVFAQLEAGALGATIRGINIRDLKRASIPVPPRDEQRGIANLLEREMGKIDTLVSKVQDAIDHLKELRTALISAAVTGKIDVRPSETA
jgi:type I restriction enzyme S subunit